MIRLVTLNGLGQGSDEGGYPFRGTGMGDFNESVPQLQLSPPMRTVSIEARALERPAAIARDAGDRVLHSTGLNDPNLNQPAGDEEQSDPLVVGSGDSTLPAGAGTSNGSATRSRWPWVVGGIGALAVVATIIAVVVSRRKKGRR